MLDDPASALRIDTCTLSPLFRLVSDAWGTLNSTVSPSCIFSLRVLRWWFTSCTVALRVSRAPIDDDEVPVSILDDGVLVVPVPICPLVADPDPEVWASTKGAAAKMTAMANTMVLLSVLDMSVFSSHHTSDAYLLGPSVAPVPGDPLPDSPVIDDLAPGVVGDDSLP